MTKDLEQTVDTEVLTEVTSVAEENKRGANIKIPDPQQLVNNAMQTFITGMRKLNLIFPKLKARAKQRVLNAILDLPTSGIPVLLKTAEEKEAFKIGQMVVGARFILTQHYVNEAILKQKAQDENNESNNK